MDEQAPQFPVDGLVSKCFYIDFVPLIIAESEELLFVESILTSLVYCFGQTFTARITSGFRKNNTKEAAVIHIQFPEYQWLYDIGRNAALFEKRCLLKIIKVYMYGTNMSATTARSYELIVKDGKKKLDNKWINGCIVCQVFRENVFCFL